MDAALDDLISTLGEPEETTEENSPYTGPEVLVCDAKIHTCGQRFYEAVISVSSILEVTFLWSVSQQTLLSVQSLVLGHDILTQKSLLSIVEI